MKIIQKYLYILIFTAALFCVALLGSPKTEPPLPRFVVQNPDGTASQDVSIYDADDGNYYVFLPSYADMDQVAVSLTQDRSLFLDDIPLVHGMDCGHFALETPYVFTVDHNQVGALWFFRSANVATLYVDTVSGNMKYLHQNNEHEESVSVTLYTEAGEKNFSDSLSKLKGRGNVTWEYDKRPYTLTLPTDTALLDMPPATKWVLLANAADETNLNNKLIFDLAKRLDFQWTPQCQWVDLYLNGEYSGLYLLTEQVEVHENRLDIDTDSVDFLCKIDLAERQSSLRNPFITQAGRTIEINHPKILKEGQLADIEYWVNTMETEILSGADLSRSSLLDLDSWVRRYLMDEIFANIDADLASCYFYRSGDMLYAGPLWDYDMTLGNCPRNQDPCAFIAKNGEKSDTFFSPYYSALYSNTSFYERMVELYRTEFLPELQKLLSSEIDLLTAAIQQASRSNSLRWRAMYENLPADVVHTPSALKDYFSRRIQFLDNAWVNNTPYCTIQFESAPGSAYKSVSVEKEKSLESPYINTETVLWVDSETDEAFDFSQPITADRILSKQHIDSEASAGSNNQNNAWSVIDYFIFLIMAILLTAVAVLAIIDLRLRKKEGQNSVPCDQVN